MIQYNIYEAKTNLSKISRLLESKQEDCVVISRNGKPVLKVVLYENDNRSKLFGCAKGMFEVPDNFDDMDLNSDFEEDIL